MEEEKSGEIQGVRLIHVNMIGLAIRRIRVVLFAHFGGGKKRAMRMCVPYYLIVKGNQDRESGKAPRERSAPFAAFRKNSTLKIARPLVHSGDFPGAVVRISRRGRAQPAKIASSERSRRQKKHPTDECNKRKSQDEEAAAFF